MIRFYSTALVFLLAVQIAPQADALPFVETAPCVNDQTKNCVIGVQGLEMLGNVYNVSFGQGPFDDLVASTPHDLLGLDGLAYLSTFLLAAPLNAAGSTISGIIGAPTGPPWSSILIAYDYNAQDVYSWGILYKQTPVQFIPFTSYPTTTSTWGSYYNPSFRTFTAYAIFTEAVALPSALWLVLGGLLGVSVSRRPKPPTLPHT